MQVIFHNISNRHRKKTAVFMHLKKETSVNVCWFLSVLIGVTDSVTSSINWHILKKFFSLEILKRLSIVSNRIVLCSGLVELFNGFWVISCLQFLLRSLYKDPFKSCWHSLQFNSSWHKSYKILKNIQLANNLYIILFIFFLLVSCNISLVKLDTSRNK